MERFFRWLLGLVTIAITAMAIAWMLLNGVVAMLILATFRNILAHGFKDSGPGIIACGVGFLVIGLIRSIFFR